MAEFRFGLQEKFGLQIDSTLLFDYPTIVQLAQHLADELEAGSKLSSDSTMISDDSGRASVSKVQIVSGPTPFVESLRELLSTIEWIDSLTLGTRRL